MLAGLDPSSPTRKVDAIIAQGIEAGGHRGSFLEGAQLSVRDLTKSIRQAVGPEIPVIAAGGLSNGQDVVDVLRLGADGAALGTLFMLSTDSATPKAHREYILKADQNQVEPTRVSRALTGRAVRSYPNALMKRLEDTSIAAVASNNIVVIDQAKDVEDAAKKLKFATSKEADAKLKSYQKRVILMNESLLHLYAKKYAACRDQAQKLIDKYPDNDSLYLVLASTTYHQHKASKAIEELKKYTEKKPTSLAIHFAAIQLQMLESQHKAALETLQHYLNGVADNKQEQYRPAIVALLVWLYQQTGQPEKAMETLDKAASIWKSDDSFASTHTPTSIVKQTAAFKLKAGRLQEAVEDYEQLVKEDPTDAQAVAGLIAAYAQVDPTKAEQYGSALPEIALNHIDVDTLEKIVPGVKRGYVKKDPNSTFVKKPKQKKKRKPLLPKKMDSKSQPDPERWLPKQERSNFRAKSKSKKTAKSSTRKA
ncbi:Putative Signal recognition particle subunit SRP72 [Rhizopus microsporus]|nr:Putative Signal recognition particle subunit SRP72 [Rhizopus microsporus]